MQRCRKPQSATVSLFGIADGDFDPAAVLWRRPVSRWEAPHSDCSDPELTCLREMVGLLGGLRLEGNCLARSARRLACVDASISPCRRQ